MAGQDATDKQKAIAQVVAKIDDQAQRLTEPDVYAKGGYQADWGGVFAPIGEAIFWMDMGADPGPVEDAAGPENPRQRPAHDVAGTPGHGC